MNIRLDQDVRIRLSEDDLFHWKINKTISQTFIIGTISLEVIIILNPTVMKSYMHCQNNMVTVVLNSKDDDTFFSEAEISDEAMIIDNINIQIDRWSKEKRSRHAERKIRENL